MLKRLSVLNKEGNSLTKTRKALFSRFKWEVVRNPVDPTDKWFAKKVAEMPYPLQKLAHDDEVLDGIKLAKKQGLTLFEEIPYIFVPLHKDPEVWVGFHIKEEV